jgi:hypothetical protein
LRQTEKEENKKMSERGTLQSGRGLRHVDNKKCLRMKGLGRGRREAVLSLRFTLYHVFIIDYTCKIGLFPVSASRVTISNPRFVFHQRNKRE